MIYVIYNPIVKHIKIGYSKNPELRLKTLQTGSSVPLLLLHCQEGTFNDEIKIHKALTKFRQEGEWFSYNACRPFLPELLRGWVDIELRYVYMQKKLFSIAKTLRSRYALQYLFWALDHRKGLDIPGNTTALDLFCKEFKNPPLKNSVRNALTELVKHQLIIRYAPSCYCLNPQIFKIYQL